jgi:soluble lytic murein transglycosylase-like protein
MTSYLSIITAAAKAAKVSAILLYTICAHESRDYTLDFALYDNGSPSYGVCQLKKDTAILMGWKGKDETELRNPYVNAKYAALYLKYEQDRYGDDWIKIASAYNAGSYVEGKVKGCPRNLKYLKLVQAKLPEELQYKLDCKKE